MTTLNLSPLGNFQQWFSNQGFVLSGGLIHTYAAGDSVPVTTYTTQSGTVPNSNPIQLDSTGAAPQEIWLVAGQSYKFVLTDANGNVLSTVDNVSGINDAATQTGIAAGTVMIFQQTTVPVGWTRVTAFDGAALRVVGAATPSNGGALDMVTNLVNPTAVDSHALTTGEMPAHTHTKAYAANVSAPQTILGGLSLGDGSTPIVFTTNNGGTAGTAHNHTLTIGLKYVDTMVCFKN